MKTRQQRSPRNRRVVIEIKLSQYRVFAAASRLIEEWSGRALGPEGLLAWRLEAEVTAEELAEIYCVSRLGYSIAEIDPLLHGEKWCWEI